jgi:hypothetical protein
MRIRCTILACVLLAGVSNAWDPLSYNYLNRVLPVTGTSSNVSIGYFGFSEYWETDTLGFDSLYSHRESYGVLRFMWAGRYGLTSSHTISLTLPGYVQFSGPGESLSAGIIDPWISVDGWVSRDPQLIIRGALRPTLKGTLESGDYREGDRHVAAELSGTVELPVSGGSGGPLFLGSIGFRKYFTAWDQVPGAPGDSADTSPAVEFRGGGRMVLPVNRELDFHAGLEFATRGETSIQSDEIPGSGVSSVDLRTGFSLDNSQLELDVDVYIRLAGENVNKEWGVILSGIGLNFGDLFSVGTGGRSR